MWGNAPELIGQDTGSGEAQEQSGGRSYSDQSQAHAQHHAMHMDAGRAQRHADTDLARLTGNGVCNQAIDAECDQHQSDYRKYSEQNQAEPRLGVGEALQIILQASGHGKGNVAIYRPDLLAQSVEHGQRILSSSHDDATLERCGSRVGNEYFRTRRLLNAPVLYVGNDAYDLENRIGDRRSDFGGEHLQSQASADRIVLAEVLPRQGLINDRYFAGIIHLNFGESAPAELSNTERAKVSFAHQLENGLPRFRMCLAGNINFRADAAVRRQRAGLGRGDDSRQD